MDHGWIPSPDRRGSGLLLGQTLDRLWTSHQTLDTTSHFWCDRGRGRRSRDPSAFAARAGADRRPGPPCRRSGRHAPRLGAPLRAAQPAPLDRRLPALLQRRRSHRARDDQRDRPGIPASQAAKLALAWAGSPDDRGHASLPPWSRRPRKPRPTVPTSQRSAARSTARCSASMVGGRTNSSTSCSPSSRSTRSSATSSYPACDRSASGWAGGGVTIAEEHFASQLIRDRLLGLARDWDQGRGPESPARLPAGERHDIGLICFGLVLSRSGWRITFLGSGHPRHRIGRGGRHTVARPDRAHRDHRGAVQLDHRAAARAGGGRRTRPSRRGRDA